MKKYEIIVERVNGQCTCGYRRGDVFYCTEMNTPEVAFCGGAYMAIFPMQCALNSGARFHFEKNSKSKLNLACPDNGKVVFKIILKNFL